MLAYAQLSPGKGFQPMRALAYYAQRLVTPAAARRTFSRLIAARVRSRHGDGTAWPEGEDHGRIMADLRRDGIAMLSPVEVSKIDEIAAYFRGQPVQLPDGTEAPLEPEANAPMAAYALHRIVECPGLLDLLNASPLLRIASDYLGCTPTLSSLGVRWSFPNSGTLVRTQSFHRDIDDWRFLKLFIYLTDVDEDSGPHSYVRTSHASSFGWRARAYAEGELKRRFGPDKIATITGPRGTAFVADTIGVHRGLPPTTRPRLVLQAQYSLLPIFAFLYGSRTGEAARVGEAYCNRLLVG